MMDRYKFRGRRLDNGEWAYGYYVQGKYDFGVEHYIADDVNGKVHEVNPATIGQFTGLCDKNGKEVYEGDIVSASWYDYDSPSGDAYGEVIYNRGWCAFCIWDEEHQTMSELNSQGAYRFIVEINGSAYDNPELLEVQDE